jgi:ubiquinone/menaquinone biosynthesis C-methylase UbiE
MTAQTTAAKPFKGIGMEGGIARWYASLTKKGLDDFKKDARRMAERVPPGGKVLEVAPGPGYFAIELAKLGKHDVTGLDISKTFVEIARSNAAEAGVKVDFRQGNAADMPFAAEAFDFIFCRAAFKNFCEPVKALQEMYRVLKPGGQAVIIDLRRDASRASLKQAIEGMNVGAINGIITKLTFRFMLLKRAYTAREFEQMIVKTDFLAAEIEENLIGLEIRLKKGRDVAVAATGSGT